MAAKKKLHKSTLILSVVLALVTAALVLVLVRYLHHLKESRHTVEKGRVVMTVDGIEIYENQFRFFATLILDQENTAYRLNDEMLDLNETIKNDVKNFVKDYIYRLREAQHAGLSLSDTEKKELHETMQREYQQNNTVSGLTLTGDMFYDYYYGLTETQFTRFCEDWALIEKYNTFCEENANTGEAEQKKAFEEYSDYLSGCDTTVLSLSLSGLSDAERETALALARELADKIYAGDDMQALLAQHCTDESLKKCGGAVRVTPSFEATFPKIYEWSQTATVGEITVIQTDSAVYVIRCEGFANFDTLKNTEELLSWTKLFYVNEQTLALLQSGKYGLTVKDEVYQALNLNDLIERARNEWADSLAD